MARLFRGLDLLHAHSERRRTPLANLHLGFRVSFVLLLSRLLLILIMIDSSSIIAWTTSALSAVAGTRSTETGVSRPHITTRDSGWRTRLILWICCMPVQNTDGQHQGRDVLASVFHSFLLLAHL
jgi:hypothetical protein